MRARREMHGRFLVLGGPLWFSYSSPARAGVRGVISGYFWDISTFNWMSYATQYQSIANYYVGHAALAP